MRSGKPRSISARVRELTNRNRRVSMARRIDRLNLYLRGWMGYYGLCQTPSVVQAQNRRIRDPYVRWCDRESL